MGNKTHPIGFRLGIVKDWQTRWFAAKQEDYRALVKEDIGIRNVVMEGNEDAGISRVEIERGTNELVVTAHTARPGIVIGRGGAKVDEMRKQLEQLTNGRVRLNVQEIRQPELDAFLVARNIADQLERRIAFRRAIRQAMNRTVQAGAQGIKVIASGRLAGADIARAEKAMEGRVPLHTLRADIDFDIAEAATDFGRIGVKVWIFKGEILPKPKQQQIDIEEMSPIQVTVRADQEIRPAESETPAPDETDTTQETPSTPEPSAPAEAVTTEETTDAPTEES
ncbi:MAG: 30S ribosomal protein S3 [Dehalococcoidia bacterium]|nr:30S ribosomal protein S3 [Dehalococcoidia bacterium]